MGSKNIRTRRIARIIVFACLLPTITPPADSAAQAKKVRRVGVLEPGGRGGTCSSGFHQGLRDLGYTEGQNIAFETRYGAAIASRLPVLAAELAALKPEIIWTHSPPAVLALKRATTSIPVVIGVTRDLVEQGIVASLARPGGNITGMELRDTEILGKRFELLKQAIPKASRIAVLVNPNDPGHAGIPANIEREARALRVQLQRVEAGGSESVDAAFQAIVQGRSDALLLPESSLLSGNRQRISKLAQEKRLPSAAGGPQFAEAGILISYGANVTHVCQRSAWLVDKILKGTKPGDLPIERASRFDFVINLKTAKRLGVTMPQWLLVKADRVIK